MQAFAPSLCLGSAQPDLEQLRPPFAGDEQAFAACVPGDAVQDVVVRVQARILGDQGRQVDEGFHDAGLGIDAGDAVGLPQVGEDLAVDPLQLVDLVQRLAVGGGGGNAALGPGVGGDGDAAGLG